MSLLHLEARPTTAITAIMELLHSSLSASGGDQQVPPVSTSAIGFIMVRLFHNGTSNALDFRLIVCDIANVTNAHIHVGSVGTNGPRGPNIVVHFFDQSSNPVSKIHGCTLLAHGTRGPADLTVRPNAGINSWEDFVKALLSGNAYVNEHTIANSSGEIRGQLVSQTE
ncbi:MAG TPA: CHRD domain-containing protein [Candidatus Dormibacteraeota bacterium]|jgi:hypothetical protein|nr:CHRD domain-containing protein [Candidatus Dormibacteraeota bacterium]